MPPRSDERAAEYFDRIAEEWDAIYAAEGQGLAGRLNRALRRDMWLRFLWVKELMARSPRGSVLDIGCGNGVYALALAAQGHGPILGLDLAPAAIQRAQEAVAAAGRQETITARVGDGFFEDLGQVFDAALAIGVFDYVGEPLPALQAARGEAHRLLATFPRSNTWRAPLRKLRLRLRGCPVFFYSRAGLEALVEQAGWRVASWTTHGCLYCLDLRRPLAELPAEAPPVEEGAPELSVVIASRNRREVLEACLRSVRETVRATAYELIVVDDASTDGTAERVQAQFPEAQLIQSAQPASWTVTNNLGVARSRGRYLLLLNDDTQVLPGALDACVAFMRSHPRAGVVSPRILNVDGTVQPCARRFPNWGAALAQALELHRLLPGNKLTSRYYGADVDYTTTSRVEAIATTCYLLRREAYGEVGPFDERFPPNFSDMEYDLRVAAAGWESWVLGDAEIIHYGGATMGLLSLRQIWDYHRGMFLTYRKHYAPRHGAVLNALGYVGIAGRLGLKTVQRLTLLDRLLNRLPQPHRRRKPEGTSV